MRSFYIAIVVFCCVVFNTSAQKFQSFDRRNWQEITKDINYSDGSDRNSGRYDQSGKKGKQRGGLDEQDTSNYNSSWTLIPFGGQIFQVIIIILFIVILVFIISKLVGNNIHLKNEKIKKEEAISIEDIEEKLMKSDLMKWLKKTVADKNYKLALRIYYLMIIKELDTEGIIQWRKEKTNLEYLMEMRSHGSYAQFEEITTIYQLIWYGDKDFGNDFLINASHKFRHYFQSITGNAHE